MMGYQSGILDVQYETFSVEKWFRAKVTALIGRAFGAKMAVRPIYFDVLTPEAGYRLSRSVLHGNQAATELQCMGH
jgi:hypothetical protein